MICLMRSWETIYLTDTWLFRSNLKRNQSLLCTCLRSMGRMCRLWSTRRSSLTPWALSPLSQISSKTTTICFNKIKAGWYTLRMGSLWVTSMLVLRTTIHFLILSIIEMTMMVFLVHRLSSIKQSMGMINHRLSLSPLKHLYQRALKIQFKDLWAKCQNQRVKSKGELWRNLRLQ